MTIEPSHVRFQFGAPCMPPKPDARPLTPRMTLEQDAAMIAKRQARRDNLSVPAPKNPPRRVEPKEQQARATVGRKVAYAAQNAHVRASILAHLAEPMTCADLSRLINLCKSACAGHLGQMRIEGLVTCSPARWRKGALWVRT